MSPIHAFARTNVGAGSSSVACTPYYEASVAYNYTSKTVEFCNGTAWANLLGASGGITLGTSAITTSPSLTGDITTGLFSAATSTVSVAAGGADIVDIGTNGLNIANGTLTGISATNNFLHVTGTLNATNTAQAVGVNFSIASLGSSSFAQKGLSVSLTSGYTGSSTTQAISAGNTVAGTGTNPWNGSSNIGSSGAASATTSGANEGVLGFSSGSSSFNLGVMGRAVGSANSPALNIGVAGIGAGATTNIGGFFGLMSTAPTLSSAAALIADNGTTSSPIFVAQVNGAPVVTIGSTGNVGIGTAAPAAKLDVWGAIDINGSNGISIPAVDSTSLAIGPLALSSLNTATTYNVALGTNALQYATSANYNIAIGNSALRFDISGGSNTAIGFDALGADTSNNNVAIGFETLIWNTTGYSNTAIGNNALAGLCCVATGHENSAVGVNAMYNVTTGSDNVAFGLQSLQSIASGNYTTALGVYAGYSATGSRNVYLGYAAGYNDTGSNSFFVNNVQESSLANDKAYSLLYGTFSGTAGSLTGQQLVINGTVGIGNTSPQATLDVSGYMRLLKNSAQPVACSATNDGAIALTHVYTLCICNGGSTSWVQSKDGSTACSW